MIKLPGNPFEEIHERIHHNVGDSVVSEIGETDATLIWSAIENHAQATLALAYEQRTANLIAWQALGRQLDETSEPTPDAEQEIADRLGFGDTK